MQTALCAADQHHACGAIVFDGERDRPCGCDCHAPVAPTFIGEEWTANDRSALPASPVRSYRPLAAPTDRCPRCNGRLIRDDGEITCMVCGWVKPPEKLANLTDSLGRKMRTASVQGVKV